MQNDLSLLKARYCRSVMRTAADASDDEAHRMIRSLASETATPGVTHEVDRAEQAAFEAFRILASRCAGRRMSSVTVEWLNAERAVSNWLRVDTGCHAASSADGGSFSPVASS
jgi:alpha-D-ribose 1-methylphosphonate 5-triphosphate synthase subunit PhnH